MYIGLALVLFFIFSLAYGIYNFLFIIGIKMEDFFIEDQGEHISSLFETFKDFAYTSLALNGVIFFMVLTMLISYLRLRNKALCTTNTFFYKSLTVMAILFFIFGLILLINPIILISENKGNINNNIIHYSIGTLVYSVSVITYGAIFMAFRNHIMSKSPPLRD